jgi:hypothetical protein
VSSIMGIERSRLRAADAARRQERVPVSCKLGKPANALS